MTTAEDLILKAIDNRLAIHEQSMPFDKTYYGKVVSINGDKIGVSINDVVYNAAVRDGLMLNIGDVVIVKAPNGNFSYVYIDCKLGSSSSVDIESLNSYVQSLKGDLEGQISILSADSYKQLPFQNSGSLGLIVKGFIDSGVKKGIFLATTLTDLPETGFIRYTSSKDTSNVLVELLPTTSTNTIYTGAITSTTGVVSKTLTAMATQNEMNVLLKESYHQTQQIDQTTILQTIKDLINQGYRTMEFRSAPNPRVIDNPVAQWASVKCSSIGDFYYVELSSEWTGGYWKRKIKKSTGEWLEDKWQQVATTDKVDILWSGSATSGTINTTIDVSLYDQVIVYTKTTLISSWYPYLCCSKLAKSGGLYVDGMSQKFGISLDSTGKILSLSNMGDNILVRVSGIIKSA